MGRPRCYQGAHQAIRRAGLAYAYGQPCARCGQTMRPGEPLHLDHDDDGDGYLGFSHAACNCAAGGRRGQAPPRRLATVDRSATRICAAVEVAWDRRHASVAVAWRDHEVVNVELAAYEAGATSAGAMVDSLVDLRSRYRLAKTLVDPRSPAANLIEPLRRARLRIEEPDVRTVSVATAEFLDGLHAETIRPSPQKALTAAVRHAKVREVAGGLAFDRRGEVDASPLLAATLAVWAARRLVVKSRRVLVPGDLDDEAEQ